MLLEILVTMGILSVGLLGVAAMQITSLKVSASSLARGEAAILTTSMVDRMRANSGVNGDVSHYSTLIASNTSYDNVADNRTQRAQRDYDLWLNEIANTFGAGANATGTITCRASTSTTTNPTNTVSNCDIEIAWYDSRGETAIGQKAIVHTATSVPLYNYITSVIF